MKLPTSEHFQKAPREF